MDLEFKQLLMPWHNPCGSWGERKQTVCDTTEELHNTIFYLLVGRKDIFKILQFFISEIHEPDLNIKKLKDTFL